MPRKQDDKRVPQFVLTKRFYQKREECLRVVSEILLT